MVKIGRLIDQVDTVETVKQHGRVTKVVGLLIESLGPSVSVGEICRIYHRGSRYPVEAEVIGFREEKVLLMPLGSMEGLAPGAEVVATGNPLLIPVDERLLGRILDGLGRPIDGKGPILDPEALYPVEADPPNPLGRPRIREPLPVGIRAMDGVLTLGKGQRVGIFSGSGVGKSTLLGMMARNTTAEINVIGLVGERGREVREFMERDLGEDGLRRSVVVVATGDKPALIRFKGALVATTIAEYFRDRGHDVMLMMDSVTRFARAQ
ncbi:MAG: EscN/YscN/HrcN family type III secretion system ATPase, partial [bacterium]|nr:EscN/YscN/HrcN family type III secretion system ATPase [bacterium]